MSEQPLLVLERLGEEFARLGEPRRRPPRVRVLVIAVAIVLLAGGAAAAALLITRGSPLPAPHAQDLRAEGVPLASSVRLAGLDVPDPEPDQPGWELRLSRTAAGESCLAVGQVLGGQFGIVGLDHTFRALPLGGVDACGVTGSEGRVLAGARVLVGGSTAQARTVVDGLAGAGARSVTVEGAGGTRRQLRLGPDGSFLAVYRGYVEEVRPRVSILEGDGHTHTISFAAGEPFEVPDPDGGSSWNVTSSADVAPRAFPDESCVQAHRGLGRGDPDPVQAPLTPSVCGRLGSEPLMVLMRRFVPEARPHAGFPWGDAPARTLVYGVADPRVRELVLTGAGAPRKLTIDREGGSFLAVLDGHVDPRSLTLAAHLDGGSVSVYRHSTRLYSETANAVLPSPPVPAYRSPYPTAERFPASDIPIAATVASSLRATDPAGAGEWELRSWRGRPNPNANFASRNPGEMLCYEVGVLRGGRLTAPPPAPAKPLSITEPEGATRCNEASWLARHHDPSGEATAYLEHPYVYAPKVLRTVVSGLLGPGARDAVLVGPGLERRLTLDRNGALLAVLPGSWWDRPLRIRATVDGRRRLGGVINRYPAPEGLARPQARAADPDGGAPWGFSVNAAGASAQGRIIEGRIAAISAAAGTLANGPEGWGSGEDKAERAIRAREPGHFDVQSGAPEGPGGREPELPLVARERRTLPGRTIITGQVKGDVETVTLTTPRDVRTLRPSGPHHVLIAVYDGQFFSGSITATMRLRDGHTVTQTLVDPAELNQRRLQAAPSLQAELAATRRQLRAFRRHRPKLPKGAPAMPSLAAIVAALEARIAFQAAHPGLLPAG